MDKSWTKAKNKDLRRFMIGAKEFSKLAEQHTNSDGKALCPCGRCVNAKFQLTDVIFDHIVQYGFNQSYHTWIYYGERPPTSFSGPVDKNDDHDSGVCNTRLS